MKTFEKFIKEDFNSPGATQFKLIASTPGKKSSSIKSSATEVIVFHEHLPNSAFNLSRYSKSFLGSEVPAIMQSHSTDWRVLIFASPLGFDVFVWTAAIQHHIMTKMLDLNKDLKKYPSTTKYNFLYNESQLLMRGDKVGPAWCFPYVIWQGDMVVNLLPEAIGALEASKNIKELFKLSDSQWSGLLNRQSCSL